jgi:catechol 2,3-dioxygenase-like lactoylglutathione lyase family enzyme
MAFKPGYALHCVADMERAVALYRDTVGLELGLPSPGGSEFATGPTTLAPRPASDENPPGATHLGLRADDIAAIHQRLKAAGVRFTRAPQPDHGITLAEFAASQGARVSLSR